MPNTTHGLPYPATTAPPNVPADLQALADALDAYLPVRLNAGNQTITNSAVLTDATAMQIQLPVGAYLIELFASVSGPAAADVKIAAAFSGTIVNGNKQCAGPALTTADVQASTVMRSSVHGWNTSIAYGTDGVGASAIRETTRLQVTVAGLYKVQWAQNTANATGTTMSGASWLEVRKIYLLN